MIHNLNTELKVVASKNIEVEEDLQQPDKNLAETIKAYENNTEKTQEDI